MYRETCKKKLGNSKLDPRLISKEFVFYSADLRFFRELHFQKSIQLGEIPILIDPSALDYWQNKFQVNIHRIDDSNLPDRKDKEDSIQKLSNLGNFQCGFASSGSTGEAKVFLKSQSELLSEINFLKQFVKPWAIQSMINSVPLCHIYGFLWSYALPLELGISVTDASSLSQLRKELYKSTANLLISVPSILQSLIGLISVDKAMHIKTIISSGSRLKTELAQELERNWEVKIFEIYGSTETGGMAYRIPSQEEGLHFFPEIETKLIEQSLCVKSPFINKDLLHNDGYFYTNDIGEIKNGLFFYQGRKDRIVKVNGKRVHLDSLEQEISALLPRTDILVTEYHSIDDITQIGLLIPKDFENNEEMQIQNIQSKLSTLPKYFQPNKIKIVNRLPSLPNGKKDYQLAKNEFHTS